MARWAIRTGVSIVVAALLLRVVAPDDVFAALRRASPTAWLASFCIFVAGHYLNAAKLRVLVGTEAGSMRTFVRAQYAGLVANLGLPGIAGGDVARAALLAGTSGLSRIVLASVSDRAIDTAVLLGLVAIALPLAGIPPALGSMLRLNAFSLPLVAAMAGALGVTLLVLAVVCRRPAILRLLRIDGVSDLTIAPVLPLLSFGLAVSISLMVQSAFVLTNVWLARSVGVTTGLAAWFVAWPLAKLVATLPISLAGIGVREAALVSLLAPYGAASDATLASGLLWQVVLLLSGAGGFLITQMWPYAPAARDAAATADPAAVSTAASAQP